MSFFDLKFKKLFLKLSILAAAVGSVGAASIFGSNSSVSASNVTVEKQSAADIGLNNSELGANDFDASIKSKSENFVKEKNIDSSENMVRSFDKLKHLKGFDKYGRVKNLSIAASGLKNCLFETVYNYAYLIRNLVFCCSNMMEVNGLKLEFREAEELKQAFENLDSMVVRGVVDSAKAVEAVSYIKEWFDDLIKILVHVSYSAYLKLQTSGLEEKKLNAEKFKLFIELLSFVCKGYFNVFLSKAERKEWVIDYSKIFFEDKKIDKVLQDFEAFFKETMLGKNYEDFLSQNYDEDKDKLGLYGEALKGLEDMEKSIKNGEEEKAQQNLSTFKARINVLRNKMREGLESFPTKAGGVGECFDHFPELIDKNKLNEIKKYAETFRSGLEFNV